MTMSKPVLHHLNLKTPRLDEMIVWYEEMVGTEVIHRFEGGAWLSNDGANHRIALLTTPEIVDDPDRPGHAGMHHSAFEFASVDDLLDHWEAVRDAHRGDLHMALDHGMTLSFYFADPDRNSVELQGDWFGDWAKSKRFMREAPEFKADPIGTFVDPDLVVAARAAGASTEELHRRAYAGEFAPESTPDMMVAGI
jgi:catechol 2,3-dioxygenase